MKLGTVTKKIAYLLIMFMGFNLSNVFAENIKEKGIVTLMYHRFEENKYPTTNIKVHDFKKQIELIKNSQNEFINFDQLKSILIDKQAYTGGKILITIDDAFQSFYQNAWPILKKENVPFILFVNTREINDGHTNYMSWDQIREVHQSEIGTIGAHSFSHEYLVKLNQKDIAQDIEQSHQDYLRELRFIPEVFSYPFGEYSTKIKKLIKNSKYKLAFGQHSGVVHREEDLFELPRFPINEAYGKIDRFKFIINTVPLPHKFYKPENKLITSNNPPAIEIEFVNSVKGINCFSNEGGQWGPSEIAFLEKNWIKIILKKPFETRRGKINCTLKLSDGTWGWFGRQYVLKN
tara:strand:+ start:1341 stop:2384 length:1044 start_codon:yes stop_codon:yes gene_type:complete